METKKIYPYLCAGSYGAVLNDFRENVKLSVEEIDEIIVNHNFTQKSLEETHKLLKILWNYQVRKNGIRKVDNKEVKP